MNNNSKLCYKVIPLPCDTNYNGDVFGGWILSQMDLAGIGLCSEVDHGRYVTVTIEKMVFKNPIKIGNGVEIYGKIIKIGNTSITIKLEVYSSNLNDGSVHEITEGIFKYVKIDSNRKPLSITQRTDDL